MTPTQRSLKKMRDEGWLIEVVEKWNAFVRRPDGGMGKRQDLFGFGDLLAVRGDETLIIQTTTTGVSERIRKIMELQAHLIWLDSPNRHIHVHGWRKLVKVRGKKAKYWDCRVVDIRNVTSTPL